MYSMFEFDVTGVAGPGANALAVEVFAPTESDFTITYVDWNPHWASSDSWHTPMTSSGDLTALQNLPPAKVTAVWHSDVAEPDQVDHVTVENASSQLAFFVHLTVLKGQNGAISRRFIGKTTTSN